jgi:hypothetical protein
MSLCPFYRRDRVFVERRRHRRANESLPPELAAAWCAHLYSPVSKYVATRIAGGADKLQCTGDLTKCQVREAVRPKL